MKVTHSAEWLKQSPIVGVENPLEQIKGMALPTALQILENTLPGVAARVAERLFMSPPKFQAPDAEREFVATGHRFSVPFRGGRLAAWSWGDGPTVFLVHGWAGRGGQMTPFVRPLVEAGYSVVLFDAPAHGESSGNRASLIHFRDALMAVVNEHGPAHAVIAHSMGAASAALALQAGMRAEKVILIGSPASPNEYAKQFVVQVGCSENLFQHMKARLEARFGFNWDDLSIPKLARRMTVPALIVHDRQDRDAPWEDGAEIARCWPNAKLLTTSGLGHRRVLRAPEVVGQVIEFVRS